MKQYAISFGGTLFSNQTYATLADVRDAINHFSETDAIQGAPHDDDWYEVYERNVSTWKKHKKQRKTK